MVVPCVDEIDDISLAFALDRSEHGSPDNCKGIPPNGGIGSAVLSYKFQRERWPLIETQLKEITARHVRERSWHADTCPSAID
jgi:hypothetical protein